MGLSNLPDPNASTGFAYMLYRSLFVIVPIMASLVAFWLGIRFVPVRKGHEYEDTINRIAACLVSSFLLGIFVLVVLHTKWPTLFESAGAIAAMACLPPAVGFFTLTACIMILCGIPGPWLLGAVFLWLERSKGKDISEILNSIRRDK